MIASVYIHVPFCKQICSYCDFCKMYYKKEWVTLYLEALKREIQSNPPIEKLKTIYVGGGTPSILSLEEMEKLLLIIDSFPKEKEYEFTFECNIESINEDKMKLLSRYGVNRISYGVETFHTKYLKILNRHHTTKMVEEIISMTKRYIPNINVDFIYALPNETVEDVKEDITEFLKLDIPHISTYSLIVEANTVLGNKNTSALDEEVDKEMYDKVIEILKQYGYEHYEISNFSRPGYRSKHNLTYWDNLEYYGYGLGASGYCNHIRYSNTRSLNHYLKGKYRLEEEKISLNRQMEDEMMLGLRKIDGVSMSHFQEKFHCKMEDVFPIIQLVERGLLEVKLDNIRITDAYQYLSNEVLVSFIGEE